MGNGRKIVHERKILEVHIDKDMDLHMRMDVNLTEALTGFKRSVKTLDARQIIISTLPGEFIKPNEIKCVLNEGMPMYKNPFEKGRLIIVFNVIFPEKNDIDLTTIKSLEKCLPAKPKVDIPMDHEEHTLIDLDPAQERSKRADAMEDDGGMGGGAKRVQCANQ